MSRKLQIGSAALLMIAAVATVLFVVREYRNYRVASSLLYTRSVKKHDIVDAARNALSALTDAELREQNYVLTGETVYSEAYAADIRSWEDESGALKLVARNDPAAPLAQDLSEAGAQTTSELAAVVSLYDKSGRDAALDRIRKSSGIVYLGRARSSVAQILDVDGGAFDGTSQMVKRTASSFRRLAAGAVVLFFLAVANTLLLVFGMRARAEQSAGLEMPVVEQRSECDSR